MTGTVRRDPDGSGWIADITVKGRRRTAKTPTRASAEKRLRELRELLSGTEAPEKNFSLAKARDLSLRVRWANRPYERTARIYCQAALDWFGDVRLEEISTPAVEAWRADLAARGNQPATINRKVSALRAMLADACLYGHLAAVPRMPPQMPPGRFQRRVFEPAEEAAFCQAFMRMGEPEAADLFVFLVETAARFSEASRLRGRDVEQGVRWKVTFSATKNQDSRTVPLTRRAEDAIRGRLPAVPAHRVWSYNYGRFRCLFDRAKALLGLAHDRGLTTHSTRHTCATRLAASGISEFQLMRYGGWRSQQAVKAYVHLNTDALDGCVDVLERRISSTG